MIGRTYVSFTAVYEAHMKTSRGIPPLFCMMLSTLTACTPDVPDDTAAQISELEARFTPGLHTLMVEMGTRHATLWFAGDASNWELADYMAHELAEVVESVQELHPEYDEIPIASLMREMGAPQIADVEAAIDARDHAAFLAAYDHLTASCNACHQAADRTMIVLQRPTVPPLTNLRFAP